MLDSGPQGKRQSYALKIRPTSKDAGQEEELEFKFVLRTVEQEHEFYSPIFSIPCHRLFHSSSDLVQSYPSWNMNLLRFIIFYL